jgi:hypothetical protein
MLGRTLHLALYPGRHCSGGHAGPGVPAGPGVRRNPPPPGRNCRTGYVAGGGTGPASAGSIQPGPSPGRAEIAFTMIIGASAGGHGDAGYRGSGRGRRRAGWWPRAGPSGFRGCWAGPARGCGCLLPGRWPGRPLAAAVPGRSWCPCRTRRTRWPWSSPRSATSAPVASKIRKPTSPSVAIRAKPADTDIHVRCTVSGGRPGEEATKYSQPNISCSRNSGNMSGSNGNWLR